MKSFLIIGLGRFGASLAVELCAQGHEVLAVDIQPERVQAVADQVTHCVVGMPGTRRCCEAWGLGILTAPWQPPARM